MMFQQSENTYDVTLLCMGAAGFILLIGYVAFSNFVTHQGNFYQNRRWKASVWVANIFGIILGAPLSLFTTIAIIGGASGKNIFETIATIVGAFLSIVAFITPFTLMVCVGTRYQLKWWINIDDYLDKIWEDPNKGHKSPIQEDWW